jgi:hypothetical protein
MEQIEDLDSYNCTNSKRRMTLITIKEATRQQTRDLKIAERGEDIQLQIEEDRGDGSRFGAEYLLIFFFAIFGSLV